MHGLRPVEQLVDVSRLEAPPLQIQLPRLLVRFLLLASELVMAVVVAVAVVAVVVVLRAAEYGGEGCGRALDGPGPPEFAEFGVGLQVGSTPSRKGLLQR